MTIADRQGPASAPQPARWLAPLAPVLSGLDFLPAWHARPPSVLEAGQRLMVTSGRIAIGLALRAMGVGPGTRVLVPAYHSLSMIPPILHLGAQAEFYHVRPDTHVDLDDLAARIEGVAAVIVTHYFGFPQHMAPIRALCDRHGVPLLEDCAHSLFGVQDGRPIGTWGDYATASTMKFLPTYDGGCLVSARHRLQPVPLRSAGVLFEAKAAVVALERSFAHRRLRGARLLLALPLRLQQALWRWNKQRLAPTHQAQPALSPAASDNGFDYDPQWLDKRNTWFSRAILQLSSQPRLCSRRRRHYLRLEQAVRGMPGCRPLFPTLPAHVVPWVFPLLVDDPEPVFTRLQAAGVPLVRFGLQLWEGAEHCSTSASLGRHVLGFPCHQTLTKEELDAILAAMAKLIPA